MVDIYRTCFKISPLTGYFLDHTGRISKVTTAYLCWKNVLSQPKFLRRRTSENSFILPNVRNFVTQINCGITRILNITCIMNELIIYEKVCVYLTLCWLKFYNKFSQSFLSKHINTSKLFATNWLIDSCDVLIISIDDIRYNS